MNTDLAYIRNELLNDHCTDEITNMIKATQRSLVQSNNPFFPVCQQAITNALEDIESNKFEDAGYQINFIHNIPMQSEDFNKWNSDHFYEFEVPLYFEHTNGVERIKKMIAILADLSKYNC